MAKKVTKTRPPRHERNVKCSLPENPCISMEENAKPEGRVSGISYFYTHDFRRNKSMFRGMVFRLTPSSKGLMLNHCPWCGEDISAHHEGKS